MIDAAYDGAFGRPVVIDNVRGIPGPRAGALEIFAGLNAGRLLKALNGSDAALLRQFIPWNFVGEPCAYMSGRALRVEAGWPPGVAEVKIHLHQLGEHPRGGGRWIAGRNERGHTIIAGLNNKTPHFLVSGSTGSGKSVALRSAVIQLAQDEANQIVLLDGKYGESLKLVERLSGVVGPVAIEKPAMRAALGWTCEQMRRRYRALATAGNTSGRLVVVFDEFQEAVSDTVIVDLMRKIAAQGRAAGVHLMAATQHPTVDAFGNASTRRNLVGKLALRVEDPDASRVAIGGKLPRADYLLGAGDAYAVGPGTIHRIQCAFVDNSDVGKAGQGGWLVPEWPEYDAEAIGQELPEVGWSYSGQELAVGLISAAEREGRPTLIKRLDQAGLGRPGSEKAARLLGLGRDAYGQLRHLNWDLCQS
jgi:hypothetical protein